MQYKPGTNRKALITGITGQDGSYLADLLLSKEYSVYGLIRPVSAPVNSSRLSHILDRIELYPVALEEFRDVLDVVQTVKPDECYHLGGHSVVHTNSLEHEIEVVRSNIAGAHHLLAALKSAAPKCRFFFAGSSEMFGLADEFPQRETTPFHPRTAYGVSKVAAFELTRTYLEQRGMFACSGILYNHESPRRGPQFVTRKITLGLADILAGRSSELKLGDLEARRDWGHARDYVQAMWLMMQQDRPEDFVIASGSSHSVRDFVELAFATCGLDSARFVVSDAALVRPEPVVLTGDPSRAYEILGWRPESSFEDLVKEMVRSDCGIGTKDAGVLTGSSRDK